MNRRRFRRQHLLTLYTFLFVRTLRPLIKKKLDVLSDAGLNKEDFSDLDTKTFQVKLKT